ncbi:glycogen/starch/alpha-glucan phosphorylase [Thiohalocapsa halophila]|uniref:glycogen/starch/alpha-glucan phosphorylase n=1 Tax=Thiohalocapsa halophila TaxID=69359 RepID=UPI0019046B1E|nr:glycogen/starch/alpha-glucan phosphorylase [Thiohalocapsa halophila]
MTPSTGLAADCVEALRLAVGREPDAATAYERYLALATAIRGRQLGAWLDTESRRRQAGTKRVHYLSLEFLVGRSLQNAVLNLDLEDAARDGVHALGVVLEDLYEAEHDAALGNGGLGRLAACFLDALATQGYPAVGHGIRYEYGMFRQEIRDGAQVERPDNWLYRGNPWELSRPDERVQVHFGGHVEYATDAGGGLSVRWLPAASLWAVPYITLVPGWRNGVSNPLVLWEAVSGDDFNLAYFNDGDYIRAVEDQARDETISKVLYPGDASAAGKALRLKQQYFFVAAALARILNEHLAEGGAPATLPERVAIHLNDTHPVVAVPELMRLLLDVHGLGWDAAWDITTRTFAYTNHTLMPEALERWDVGLFGSLLPRHLDLCNEINRRFLDEVARRWPGDAGRIERLSIFEGFGADQRIRMANLAIVGSHSVNGVAELHSALLKRDLFSDFHTLWPDKLRNVTNGVTQRRWLRQANPALARLITDAIGERWVTDLEALAELAPLADDAAFREAWWDIKRLNVRVLAHQLAAAAGGPASVPSGVPTGAPAGAPKGVALDPDSLFDVQVKRIHEYKRQLMNLLRVLAQYLRIKDAPNGDWTPRTVLMAGKAAPGYWAAKQIIRLACDIGRCIDTDPQVRPWLRLVFVPNYGVSLAERIFPASDLSEQISTAGTEASGTGNMKFALNGALTIGTLDGANIEIAEAVGRENIFIFGLTEPEVAALRNSGYRPRDFYEGNAELRRVLDLVASGALSPGDPDRYAGLVHELLAYDPYLVLADFADYLEAQDAAADCFRDPQRWTAMAIRNVAAMGRFSSDRSVRDYAEGIWGMAPLT